MCVCVCGGGGVKKGLEGKRYIGKGGFHRTVSRLRRGCKAKFFFPSKALKPKGCGYNVFVCVSAWGRERANAASPTKLYSYLATPGGRLASINSRRYVAMPRSLVVCG